MNAYTENMTQCATYWPRGTNDGYGGVIPGEPVPLMCRWQQAAQLYRTPEGREATSNAVVYTSIPVGVGGFLMLGHTNERLPPKGIAEEIRQIGISPALDGEYALHKAYV